MLLLDPAQDLLAPLVVLAVTDDRPVHHPNPGRHQVDVIMLGVVVPDDHVLRVLKPHLLQILTGNCIPLLVA